MIKKEKTRIIDRKASIQISMPQSLLANIDNLRWRYCVEFLFAKYSAKKTSKSTSAIESATR